MLSLCAFWTLLFTQLSLADKECKSSYECRNDKIEEDAISCNGYYGCRGATISSFTTADTEQGSVDCSASLSCHDTHGIQTDGNLYCSAYKTCYRTNDDNKVDVAGFIQCSGSNSCEHTQRDGNLNTGLSAFCGGMESCLEVNAINTKKSMHCYGERACVDTEINSENSIYCNGNSGCMEASLNAYDRVSCGGLESCAGSTIKANRVDLYGSNSGSDSKIFAAEVNVYGAGAAKRALFDSLGQEKMKINFIAEMGGTGGTVTCRSGSECTLSCRNTGCKGLELQCENGANCLVTPSTCLNDHNAGNKMPDGIYCPSIVSMNTIPKPEANVIGGSIRPWYQHKIIPRRLKKSSSKSSSSSIECLDEHQCEKQAYEDVGAKCGGFESCLTATVHAGETGDDIACHGKQSCFKADLETRDGAIDCYGEKACQYANIRGKNMNCLGFEACADIKCDSNPCEGAGRITSVGYMQCYGTQSCRDSKIKTIDSIGCKANRACLGSHIEARFDTECDGMYSCSSTSVTTNHELTCNGMGSCKDTEMKVTKLVEMEGYFSGTYSTISANEVHAFGYLSAAFTTIDSQDKGTLDIHFFGHFSGYGSSVICRAGSECNLVCKGTGCLNADYICERGSQCNMIPNKCLFDEVSVEDVTCPNIVGDGRYHVGSFKRARIKAATEEVFWTEAVKEIAEVDKEYDALMSDEDEVFDGDDDVISEANAVANDDDNDDAEMMMVVGEEDATIDDEQEEEIIAEEEEAVEEDAKHRLSAHRDNELFALFDTEQSSGRPEFGRIERVQAQWDGQEKEERENYVFGMNVFTGAQNVQLEVLLVLGIFLFIASAISFLFYRSKSKGDVYQSLA